MEEKLENKIEPKELWRVFGIFIAVITFFFLVIVSLVMISRNPYEKKLANEIQVVLDEYNPNKWTVGEKIDLKSSFSYSGAMYHLVSKNGSDKNYAVLIRINTLYGPLPAVFVYNKNKGTEFIGFQGLHGRVKNILLSNYSSIRLKYWINKIPEIVSKAGI